MATIQVQRPSPKQDAVSKALNLGQVGMGLYTGGLSGMLMATGGAKSIIDSDKTSTPGVQSSAIDRRAETQISDMDQAKLFHEVDQFMPEMPEEIKQDVGPGMYVAMAKLSAKMKAEMTGRQG